MRKNGSKFVASYSTGKDSTIAIWRAIKQGMIPVGLITTYNTDAKVTWFHGIPDGLLDEVQKSVGIPISLIKTSGEDYTKNFENALMKAKDDGAEFCVFGDIDLEEHLIWCTDRANAAGLKAYFPLWNESRESIVYEFIDSGFKAIVKVVDNDRLPSDMAGEMLTRELVNKMREHGADVCGENGEYHTFVFDGPMFKYPVRFEVKGKILVDKYTILEIDR